MLISGIITLRQTKNGDEHLVPLSDYVWNLLGRRHLRRNSDFVFQGSRNPQRPLNLCGLHYNPVIAQSGVRFSPHDLRRSYVTIGDELDIKNTVIKSLVNHRQDSDVTEGYIIRSIEKLRRATQQITDAILKYAGVQTDSLLDQEGEPDATAADWRKLAVNEHVHEANKVQPMLATVDSMPPLSPQQRAVLQCVVEGLTNQQISERLSLSIFTVKDYMRSVLRKLGVPRRLLAARMFMESQAAAPALQSLAEEIVSIEGEALELAPLSSSLSLEAMLVRIVVQQCENSLSLQQLLLEVNKHKPQPTEQVLETVIALISKGILEVHGVRLRDGAHLSQVFR